VTNLGHDYGVVQLPYIILYFTTGAVVTAALAGATISAERESRALGLLLSLPVSDETIVLVKALGVFYRALPAWSLLGLHLAVFTALGYLHPIIWLHLGMLVIWMAVFLTGMGLYFSTRFRSGQSAAVMNIATALVLWAVVPSAVEISFGRDRYGASELCRQVNPAVQLLVVTTGASDEDTVRAGFDELRYPWRSLPMGPGTTTRVVFKAMLIYTAAGLLFAWRARRRLRKCTFETSQ